MNEYAATKPTDGELLATFAQSGEEAAFAALTERHGPMVFNACLRVLHQRSDAEDAAQAVFLALAHKARDAALQQRPSLAGWLYEAAWHVSVRARDAEKLRKQREREAGTMQEKIADAAANSAAQWSQLAPLLDGELNALPEKYRVPIVLHHLQQRSVEETAQLARCSTDAAKQRLSRGREMLRARLVRRGVMLSTGVIPTLFTTHASAAVLPGTFAATTAHSAVLFLSGQAVAGGKAILLAKAAADATVRAERMRRLHMPLKVAAVVILTGAVSCVSSWLLAPPPVSSASPKPPDVEKFDPKEAWTPPKVPEGRGRTAELDKPPTTSSPEEKQKSLELLWSETQKRIAGQKDFDQKHTPRAPLPKAKDGDDFLLNDAIKKDFDDELLPPKKPESKRVFKKPESDDPASAKEASKK